MDEKKYSQLYQALLQEVLQFHNGNQRRIRKGMLSLLLVPLVFLVLLFLSEGSRVIFLLLWIVSMFGIAAYLIAVEYIDYEMQNKVKKITKKEVELDQLLPRPEERNTSAALVRGVAAKIQELGHKVGGFDAWATSSVLSGSGLSSSAAYEVLVGNILNHFFCEDALDPIQIAKIGQYAENVYFGKPCGLMDQMASSVGNIITIDFADPAKPIVEPVPVDFSQAGLALCILDSGADHADLTDEYAAIPNECRAVAAVCGGEVLRDVPFETFIAKLPECRKQCGDRAVLRAFHIYADNDRVAKQVTALREGDFTTFLNLVGESGQSSWEYLQNVIPAGYKEHQEVAVTIAAAKHFLGGKGAVRVHGGGFAGTVQAFVPVELLARFKANMEAILGEGRCHVLSIRPEGGAVL